MTTLKNGQQVWVTYSSTLPRAGKFLSYEWGDKSSLVISYEDGECSLVRKDCCYDNLEDVYKAFEENVSQLLDNLKTRANDLEIEFTKTLAEIGNLEKLRFQGRRIQQGV